jgi:hypothetical protein
MDADPTLIIKEITSTSKQTTQVFRLCKVFNYSMLNVVEILDNEWSRLTNAI